MTRAKPARCVPPSGFGYPLDGLLPSTPCRPYCMPAALIGFTLRSFLRTEGNPRVSARMSPPTVSPPTVSNAIAMDRHGKPQFLGFDPSERPSRRRSAVRLHEAPDAPLGFPFQGLPAKAASGISPGVLPRAWADRHK